MVAEAPVGGGTWGTSAAVCVHGVAKNHGVALDRDRSGHARTRATARRSGVEIERNEAPLESERCAEALKIARQRLDESASKTISWGEDPHARAAHEQELP